MNTNFRNMRLIFLMVGLFLFTHCFAWHGGGHSYHGNGNYHGGGYYRGGGWGGPNIIIGAPYGGYYGPNYYGPNYYAPTVIVPVPVAPVTPVCETVRVCDPDSCWLEQEC